MLLFFLFFYAIARASFFCLLSGTCARFGFRVFRFVDLFFYGLQVLRGWWVEPAPGLFVKKRTKLKGNQERKKMKKKKKKNDLKTKRSESRERDTTREVSVEDGERADLKSRRKKR